jgi:hypothetical protein
MPLLGVNYLRLRQTLGRLPDEKLFAPVRPLLASEPPT